MANDSSHIPLMHELTGMCILNCRPVELSIRPVGQLLYCFMPLPLTSRSDVRRFLVVYEPQDPKPRRHLLVAGQSGHCLPFPVAGDVIEAHGGYDGLHDMVGIRNVEDKKPRHAQLENYPANLQKDEDLVDKVDMSHLRQRPGSRNFEVFLHLHATLCWHSLIQIMTDMKATIFYEGVPVEWHQRPE